MWPTNNHVQLTVSEKASLIPDQPVSEGQSIYHFFLIWTLKEAYTKALGIGLGFDFKRVEYDSSEDRIKVDGEVLRGWEFQVFELRNDQGEAGGYLGVVAIFVGGGDEARIVKSSDSLSTFTAEQFLNRAIRDLGGK
jgi:4'-phosphopantetheinyl transferase